MRGEGQTALLAPTFLPAGLGSRSQAEIAAALPFSTYHNSLALREQMRQAFISSSDAASTNPNLTPANPQSNPLAYQILGQAGLAMDQIVGRQFGP